MDCAKIRRKLSAYMDNELPDAERPVISTHLSACRECHDELNILKTHEDYLKQLTTLAPSAGFSADFWRKAGIKEEAAETNAGIIERVFLRWVPVPMVCSAIIVFFSAFSVFSPVLYGIADNETSKRVAALAADTFMGCSMKNVFAPLNFIEFCNSCHHLLCKSCREGTCSECSKCKGENND